MGLSKYKFYNDGFESLGKCCDEKLCRQLNKKIYSIRNFNNIFLTKSEYLKLKKRKTIIKGNNPRPGRNLLHKLNSSFIFENKKLIKNMRKVLGPFYKILDFKLVMGVPLELIPEWVIKKTGGFHSVNLGSYIKPKYRDMTYFKGIDFHQDIIDFPDRTADFITAYIYLDKVKVNTSPLYVIPRSHLLGASKFPHKIFETKGDNLVYRVGKKSKNLKSEKILGGAGTLSFWHPFVLHGTKPHEYSKPRISVRVLIEKNRRSHIGCLLDRVNDKIIGKKKLMAIRTDMSRSGKIIKKRNIINSLKK